jgi:oligogalacturonide lyase
MGKGKVWAPEWSTYNDMETGVRVTQLTNYKGHSHHLYFTNNGWYDRGNKLVFGSDRGNRSDLFSIDLRNGEITQLTDTGDNIDNLTACLNPRRREAYFWQERKIVAIDLDSLNERVLYERPEHFRGHIMNVTADGKYVCTSIHEQLPAHLRLDRTKSADFLKETFEHQPTSRIIRISTDNGAAEIICENQVFLAHVNTSPTQAHLLTFCHEGPWNRVENRIWGLNMNTGDVWMIRPRTAPEETIGHEYWHADGLSIGYHGSRAGERFFGKVRYDNTGMEEESFPFHNGHVHSNDYELIVGDGQPGTSVRLWQRTGNGFSGPRTLCAHRGSCHVQKLHIHRRFDATAGKVLFTSDMSGYGNLYLAQVPDFGSLPEAVEQ